MPSSFAARGDNCGSTAPSSEITPPSGCTAPVRILMSVDLPAPFSPTSACTSPARSSSDARRSACTPAYALVTSVARRSTRSASAEEGCSLSTVHVHDLPGRLAEVAVQERRDRPDLAVERHGLPRERALRIERRQLVAQRRRVLGRIVIDLVLG